MFSYLFIYEFSNCLCMLSWLCFSGKVLHAKSLCTQIVIYEGHISSLQFCKKLIELVSLMGDSTIFMEKFKENFDKSFLNYNRRSNSQKKLPFFKTHKCAFIPTFDLKYFLGSKVNAESQVIGLVSCFICISE